VSYVETIVVVSLVALAALVALTALGDAIGTRADCAAEAISTLRIGTGCTSGGVTAALLAAGDERDGSHAAASAALTSTANAPAGRTRAGLEAGGDGGDPGGDVGGDLLPVAYAGDALPVTLTTDLAEGAPRDGAQPIPESATIEPEARDGCDGWFHFSCHIGNALGWAYDKTGLDTVVDALPLEAVHDWIDTNVYQRLPDPIRAWLDFAYGAAISGPARMVTGMLDGVGGILHLGELYGRSLWNDPGGTLLATLDFATSPDQWWDAVRTVGGAIWDDYKTRCTASATGAGECVSELAADIALLVTTGGTGNAAVHTKDLRYLEHLDDVADTTRLLDRAGAPFAHADELADAARAPELLRNATKIHANEFVTIRGLGEYEKVLGTRFSARLASLRRGDHWIDMGAGDARAMATFLRDERFAQNMPRMPWPFRWGERPPQTTALGYEAPANLTELNQLEGFRYLGGRYLEETPLAELGRGDLVTDLYGPASYTPHLDDVLGIYGEVAKPGADIFFLVDRRTKIVDAAGNAVNRRRWISEWLREAQGVRGVELRYVDYGGSFIVHVRRTSGPVSIPKLELTSFTASDGVGNPYRVYRWH